MASQLSSVRILGLLWLGVALFVGGQIVDVQWHVTHDEFETADDQLRAHWLLWGGTLVILVAAAIGLRRPSATSNIGLTITLAAGAAYVAVHAWHFVAHSNRADPELAHLLLLLSWIAMLAGVIWATLLWRRGSGRVSVERAAGERRRIQRGT